MSEETELVNKGKKLVEDYISNWAPNYYKIVKFGGEDSEKLKFTAEFSKPSSNKPVPEVSVKVHFVVEVGSQGLEFQFENESLVHKPGRSIRPGQIEVWIDRIYNGKLKLLNFMNLVTNFEHTRLLPPEEVDEDAFYQGCELLESTLGEISYHDEVDEETKSIYELMCRYDEETHLPNGASQTKQKLPKISTFEAIASVLGVQEDSPSKKVGEKTSEQKLTEFLKLYPHLSQIDAKLGKLDIKPEQNYYYEAGENGQVEKQEIDQSIKRHKKEAQVLSQTDPNGGTMEYIYKGEWNRKNGCKDGRGNIYWPQGQMYSGMLHDDEMNGVGRLIHCLEDVYEGDWHKSMAHGPGKYVHSNGVVYTGEFLNDQPHGHGVENWPDGSVYEGQWSKGKKQGQGTFTWNNGSVYKGGFKNNLMHGVGTYTWADGRSYEGEWNQGKMHGKGVFKWEDGRRYEGNYNNDEKEGYGEYYWPDGRVLKCNWERGLQNGEGYYTSPEEVTRRGLWKNGERKKWFKEKK